MNDKLNSRNVQRFTAAYQKLPRWQQWGIAIRVLLTAAYYKLPDQYRLPCAVYWGIVIKTAPTDAQTSTEA